MKTLTRDMQEALTPDNALELLQSGNQRFVSNLKMNRNLLQQVNETRDGQYPFAAILSCIDSRAPAELIFDQGLGDIFSIRIAGNFINEDILGSMEFACKIAGSKLIVVLGHTHCGAIKGACDDIQLGHLTQMLAKLKPAVEKVTDVEERTSSNIVFVNKIVHQNVQHALQEIKERSPVLNELVDEGKIKIVGAIYDIETGEVRFLE
ncbi:MAG: carbonic anhydrase family protein [Bacteriovoracaceae bacterium]